LFDWQGLQRHDMRRSRSKCLVIVLLDPIYTGANCNVRGSGKCASHSSRAKPRENKLGSKFLNICQHIFCDVFFHFCVVQTYVKIFRISKYLTVWKLSNLYMMVIFRQWLQLQFWMNAVIYGGNLQIFLFSIVTENPTKLSMS